MSPVTGPMGGQAPGLAHGMGGVSGVTARIDAIEQRFSAQRFDAVLASVQARAATPQAASAAGSAAASPGASPGAPAPTTLGGRSFQARPTGWSGVAARPSAAGSAPGASTWASAEPGAWAARLPERGRAYAPALQQAAEEAGVDPRLLASLVWAESNFRADARSHAGAIGLAQLMPGTAAGLGVDPHDPMDNLRGGARYLAAQLDRFGREDLALAAYNAGPGRVARAGGIPDIAETRAYVPRVLSYYAQLGGRA